MKKIITTIMFFCLFTLFNVGLADKIKLPFGHISNPSAENLPTFSGTCEDLYPIKSFDDLMFQLYSHLDDDCLYLMPMAELSEKLGIGVVPYSFNRGKVMEGKDTPYRNFRDGIWLEKMDIGKVSVPDKLTLEQQRELYAWTQQSPYEAGKPYKKFRRIMYNIFVTPTYEQQVEQIFQYHLPPKLPAPSDEFDSSSCTEKKKAKVIEQLSPSRLYSWQGYSGARIFFTICGNSVSSDFFIVLKYFYLL